MTTKEPIQVDINELRRLRPTMTIPKLSEYFGIGARKLEKLLAKYKIKKYG